MNPETTPAAYFAWLPRLEKKDVIGVLLRAGSQKRPPGSNPAFLAAVLSACEISASAVVLVAHPLFTSYFTGDDLEECWLGYLMVEGAVTFSAGRIAQKPVNLVPTQFGEVTTYAPVTVLADFERRADAVRCRKALIERATPEAYLNRLDLRTIPAGGHQLRIEVAESTWEDAGLLSERAELASEVCRSYGGRTAADFLGT